MAFNIKEVPSEEIAIVLGSHYEIAVKGELHCGPNTHAFLEITEQGAVHASLDVYNNEQEVEKFLDAVKEISQAYMEI